MSGRKRRFLIAGALNVLFSNCILQVLLYSQLLNAAVSTFAYQAINGASGYIIYGKFVFKSSNLKNFSLPFRFLILNLLLWGLNWMGLRLAESFALNLNIVALCLIVPLASCSYVLQKLFVFNR